MGAGAKILLGLIIILVGFGLFMDSPSLGLWDSVTGIEWLSNFIIVVTGLIPAILILLGVFIVWLEADELKAEKEMKTEEPKEAEEVKEAVVADKEEKPARKPAARKKKK